MYDNQIWNQLQNDNYDFKLTKHNHKTVLLEISLHVHIYDLIWYSKYLKHICKTFLGPT